MDYGLTQKCAQKDVFRRHLKLTHLAVSSEDFLPRVLLVQRLFLSQENTKSTATNLCPRRKRGWNSNLLRRSLWKEQIVRCAHEEQMSPTVFIMNWFAKYKAPQIFLFVILIKQNERCTAQVPSRNDCCFKNSLCGCSKSWTLCQGFYVEFYHKNVFGWHFQLKWKLIQEIKWMHIQDWAGYW